MMLTSAREVWNDDEFDSRRVLLPIWIGRDAVGLVALVTVIVGGKTERADGVDTGVLSLEVSTTGPVPSSE